MDTLVSVLTAASLSMGLAWTLVRSHRHPDLVSKAELKYLRDLIQTEHEAVLRELSLLQRSIDRLTEQ